MANLTISVNDEVLKRARIRALEENRSVNAILNQYLEHYAQTEDLNAQTPVENALSRGRGHTSARRSMKQETPATSQRL